MSGAEYIAIGKIALALGDRIFTLYCELNKDNAEAFSTERSDAIINAKTTDEKLRAAGLDPKEF